MPKKKWGLSGIVALSFLMGVLVTTAFTQSQAQPLVVDVGFMKVEPGKGPDYLRFERELWKPVHQERIRTGRLKSWSLYQVGYPHGTEREYGFVTVNVYNSINDLERSIEIEDVFAKVHPNVRMSEISAQTQNARRLVRGEMWRRLEHIE